MSQNDTFRIAVLPGDGIGPEVMTPCLELLGLLEERLGGFHFEFQELAGGGGYYRETGEELPRERLPSRMRSLRRSKPNPFSLI